MSYTWPADALSPDAWGLVVALGAVLFLTVLGLVERLLDNELDDEGRES